MLGLVAGCVACAVVAVAAQAPSTDWPQWRGPERNGVSRETGLLREWPRSGPAVVWSASQLGAGYGSVAVAGSRVFVQGMKNRQSVVTSLDRAAGKAAWSIALGSAQENDRGSGPRGTPTVDGDRVYVLTENGDLVCLLVADGKVVWRRNILREFNGRNINWLVSESPLIDGDRIIVSPGGRNAGMVALDKMTGTTVWVSKELSDEAGYASSVVADVQGVRTIMTLTGNAGIGVRATDGKVMWRYGNVANNTANITTPIYSNGKVFFTSAYGTGGALLGLRATGQDVSAQEIYFTRNMQNHHGGVVLVDGYLYGFNNSILTCLEFETGKVMWRDRSVGKGSVALRRRPSLRPERGQRRRSRGGVAEGVSGDRPVLDCRSRVAELGASGDQRWTALLAKPERARQLRAAGEVKHSGWWLSGWWRR